MESTRRTWMNNYQVDDLETSVWKVGSNNAWIWIVEYHHSVFRPDGKPPLPALLTLEPHVPSTDRSNEELQFEEIRLTWSTSHPTINPPNRQNTKNKKMSHHHFVHIPIYEGEEDPRWHWFVCEKMWDVADIIDEDKQIAQFVGTLRKRALPWYMNFMESQNRSKAEMKANFLAFFKTEDVTHLAA